MKKKCEKKIEEKHAPYLMDLSDIEIPVVRKVSGVFFQ